MKKIHFLVLLLFVSGSQAQNNNSLLWEISGNGLTKKSHLYGTMHVNDKISFHLSDSFFTTLLAADMVANESNPETWGEITDLIKEPQLSFTNKFYSGFYLLPASKEVVNTLFNSYTNYFDNLMSGAEGSQADFQENTVLDMFIYQTGRKYNKKIVGLENAKESILSLLRLKPEDSRPKEENKALLVKLLKNKSYNTALNEYYREKNIVLLDSLFKLMLSKKMHDALIVNRNVIMTNSIDSLVRKGSLFSAVGAAHLAGDKGIIEMLRKKGYSLRPIIDSITEKGNKQKTTIEAYFPNPNFTIAKTKDGMIQIPLNKRVIENYDNLGSPDFTNGGAINIRRIPLNYFLNKDVTEFNPKALDSLFFEKIAGNILEKKYFTKENYTGYDIKSITKNGNSQHYRFYITPLELIAVAMTGPGNYARQYENNVFEDIRIKTFGTNWEKIVPEKGGFSIEVPAFHTVLGNTSEKTNNIQIQAYENAEKGYYFLTERTLDDESLENSAFEHKQIHYEFYLQHHIDSLETKYDQHRNAYESASKMGDRTIRLKTVIKGSKYYLLGTVNASAKNTSRFFDSFATAPYTYDTDFRQYSDSIANFTIEIPEKQNEKLFLKLNQGKEASKNTFLDENEYYSFNSKSGKTVHLQYYKYPKYENRLAIDSIQSEFRKRFLKQRDDADAALYEDDDEYDYNNQTSLLNANLYTKKGFSPSKWSTLMKSGNDPYVLLEESISFDEKRNMHTITATVSKQHATQAIKYKVVLKNDSYYVLNTLVEKNYKNEDVFIERTFNSLHPSEMKTISDSGNKVLLFITDAKSESDTIRYSALKSLYQLNITKTDFEPLQDFLNTFNFKDSETESAKLLLEKIGGIKDPRVIPFLENYYKRENTKTTVQISVLKAIANQKTKLGYKKVLELLDYDLPLSDNEYEITSLFYFFEKDMANSKELFPKIFEYYSIKEYNKPIINFCNALLDKNLISTNKIKSYKKIIATNAKLEYKRIVSWKEKNRNQDEPEEDSEAEAPVEDLINYINLIYNYPLDNAMTLLLEKIKMLEIPELDIELLRLDILNDKLNAEQIKTKLDTPASRFLTIQLLLNKNRKELISSLSDEEIAKSALINFENLTENDSVNYLEKIIRKKSGKEISFYFFQIEEKAKDEEVSKKQLYTLAFINDNKKINPLAYKVIDKQVLNDTDEIKDTYDSIINIFINADHTRASFEKEKPVNHNAIFEDY